MVAPPHHLVDVGVGDAEGVRHLLGGRRPGLPDVVAADAHRIRSGHGLDRVLDGVADELDRRVQGIDPRATADDLFEDVVLGGGRDLGPIEAELLPHGLVHGQHDGGHGVDGEPCPYPVQVDPVKGDLEVPQAVHGHPHPAHLALGHGVVRVEAHLSREVESDVEATLAVGDHQLEAFVGLPGGPEAGVLPGGPFARPIPFGEEIPGERVLARLPQVLGVFESHRGEILWTVLPLHRDP